MASVFTPEHTSFDKMFIAGQNYIIPSYQRPYSWQCLDKNDKNNQVNQMWDDLWDFFCNQSEEKEYFFGSMVIVSRRARHYEVIDGQQRLTTVTLLFAAMRCFLRELKSVPEVTDFVHEAIITLEGILYNKAGIGLVKEPKVKIQKGSSHGYDYDQVLRRAIGCERTPKLSADDAQYEPIVSRYFDNREYFCSKLKKAFFPQDGKPLLTTEKAGEFDRFFKFLTTRVSIVLINTADFDTAFYIFEVLNNRGLPLTNQDLLRNLLIREMDEATKKLGADAPAAIRDPAGAWSVLEHDYRLTEDFIGRWVESRQGAKQRTSAFNELKDIYDKEYQDRPSKPRAFQLYETLREDLQRYNLLLDPEQGAVTSEPIRNRLRFFRHAGNDRDTGNLLLSLFRHYRYAGQDHDEVLAFLIAYQQRVLYTLLKAGERFPGTEVYLAIKKLNEGNPHEAKLRLQLPAEDRQRLPALLKGPITDNGTARLLLATYVWRDGAEKPDVVRLDLDLEGATLEHIIPINPAAQTNWLKDFPPQFRDDNKYRLGNMTLLLGRMNSAARNYDFEKKKVTYKKTRLSLTHELAALSVIRPADIEQRQERIVSSLLSEFDLDGSGGPTPASSPTLGGASLPPVSKPAGGRSKRGAGKKL